MKSPPKPPVSMLLDWRGGAVLSGVKSPEFSWVERELQQQEVVKFALARRWAGAGSLMGIDPLDVASCWIGTCWKYRLMEGWRGSSIPKRNE